MRLSPDRQGEVRIELYETDDLPASDAIVTTYLDYPVLVEVSRQRVVLHDGDGATVLWSRDAGP